jgi:hypothetical protein
MKKLIILWAFLWGSLPIIGDKFRNFPQDISSPVLQER